jgi:hypothetical protein
MSDLTVVWFEIENLHAELPRQFVRLPFPLTSVVNSRNGNRSTSTPVDLITM